MPITTYHRFIDNHPVKPSDTRMILGTIHPHNVETFKIPFFYGNEGFLWKHLGKAFPCRNFGNKNNIIQTLEDNNVWISDIISQCGREHSGVFRDNELFDIKLNVKQIAEGLFNSQIDRIFFTSAFGYNNAAKLFTTAFGIKYVNTWDKMRREFKIPSQHFGREITGIVMYSPTDGANQGIARGKLYKEWVGNNWSGTESPMNAFKIAHYREKMNFLSCL